MAVPKRKTSKSRKRMRRSHHALTEVSPSSCSHCGAPSLPHRVCGTCGHYGDKEVLKVEE